MTAISIAVVTVTLVLGGVYYLARKDKITAENLEKQAEAEDEIETQVKKKHSLLGAINASRKLNGLR